MRFLHTMVRVKDVDASLDFYCTKLGLVEMRRKEVPQSRFTLIFLAAPKIILKIILQTINFDSFTKQMGRCIERGELADRHS